MKRIGFNSAVIAGLLMAQAGWARAEQAKAAAAATDPAKEKAMEAMQALGRPNAAHSALAAFVGNWNYTGQFWMAPDTQPQTMTGTATISFILGGRFLRQEFHGESKDMPAFEGLGFTGYDNIRKEYASIWLDNMSTGMMNSVGAFDAAAKTLTEQGDFSCPITGEAHRKSRSLLTSVDADHASYVTYMYTPEGKEFKAMEINYTRRSSPCPPAADRC